jgi:regulator of sigma E protease
VDAIRTGSLEKSFLNMDIMRGGKVLTLDIKPDISRVTNIFGQTISRPMVGIAPKDKILSVSYDPLRAIYFGGKRLVVLTGMTYKGIWLLVTGGLPVKGSVSGPIGIARLMSQAAELGLVPLFIITAHVSMALAVFNLLPFPVLDGGHIIFLALEKLRRKPLSVKTQEIITQVAVFILVGFALFVTWQDLLKFIPFGGGK